MCAHQPILKTTFILRVLQSEPIIFAMKIRINDYLDHQSFLVTCHPFKRLMLTSTSYQLFYLALGLGITFLIAFLLNRFITKRIEKLFAKNPSLVTTYRFLSRFILLITILVGVTITAFAVFPGLESVVSSLIITAGFLSIVVGLAAQQSISNLIAGLLSSIARPVEVGDAVRFHDDFCYVEDITLTNTILRTWDNRRLIVPNSTLISEVITNYTKNDPAMLAPIFITITYESDVDKAMEIMVKEAKAHHDCLPLGDLPSVVVMDYDERGIKLRLLSRAKDQPTAFMMTRDLLYSIKKRFDEEGIVIAPARTYIALDQATQKQIIDFAKTIIEENARHK